MLSLLFFLKLAIFYKFLMGLRSSGHSGHAGLVPSVPRVGGQGAQASTL